MVSIQIKAVSHFIQWTVYLNGTLHSMDIWSTRHFILQELHPMDTSPNKTHSYYEDTSSKRRRVFVFRVPGAKFAPGVGRPLMRRRWIISIPYILYSPLLNKQIYIWSPKRKISLNKEYDFFWHVTCVWIFLLKSSIMRGWS